MRKGSIVIQLLLVVFAVANVTIKHNDAVALLFVVLARLEGIERKVGQYD